MTVDLFIYDIQGNLILEANQSGEILKEYLYLEGNRVAQYGYDELQVSQGPRPRLAQRGFRPTLQLSIFSGSKPVKKPEIRVATAGLLTGILIQVNPGDIYNEVLYYYVNNHLGTPQLMVDHEGLVVWRADYEPFGAAAVDPGSSTINQLRFPGQYADDETQLHYNYHRYYDPRSGRYITADPMGLRAGINLYDYVWNNPTNWFDSFGLSTMQYTTWDCKGNRSDYFINFVNPTQGAIRPPDPYAYRGSGYLDPRSAEGIHHGIDILGKIGDSVAASMGGTVRPDSLGNPDAIMVCKSIGTICCNGKPKAAEICLRFKHITPFSNLSGSGVTSLRSIGTIQAVPSSSGDIITPHVHVEVYVTNCSNKPKTNPTPYFYGL